MMSADILQKTPFEIFEIPASFSINEGELEKQYLQLQQQYHPDQYKDEEVSAMALSASINDAYQVMKSPLLRSELLLQASGITVNKDDASFKPTPDILMESMELREQLADLHEPTDLKEFHKTVRSMQEGAIQRLDETYKQDDLQQAAKQTIRLKYIEKLLQEIRSKQRALMEV